MALAWFRHWRGPVHRIPGGKTQTFTTRVGSNHAWAEGRSEVRLGHSGLGLGQGHQVSRLAGGAALAWHAIQLHANHVTQVLRPVASPELWKVLGQSHVRQVYKVKTPRLL